MLAVGTCSLAGVNKLLKMALNNPQPYRKRDTPQNTDNLDSLSKLASPRSLDPLISGPNSAEYFSTVLTILQDAKQQIPFYVPENSKQHLEKLELLEWSTPYPASIALKQVPFFSSDQDLHEACDQACQEHKTLSILLNVDLHNEKRSHRRARRSDESQKGFDDLPKISQAIKDLHSQLRLRHENHNVQTPGGFLRLTDIGHHIINATFKQSPDVSLLIVKSLLRLAQLDPTARRSWTSLVDHITKLVRLPNPDLQLRKLYFGVTTKSLNHSWEGLEQRLSEIESEYYTDVFLAAPKSDQGRRALRWLNKNDGGNYCPLPYPSWREAEKKECGLESRKIVTRSRLFSYTTFPKLRLETKRLGGGESLFTRFARDTHEQCLGVHGSDLDTPPGRGLFLSGPRLEKLFHADPSRPHDALARVRDSSSWFEPALPLLDETSILALRGWIAILNPCEAFELFGTRYCFVVDNHHLSPLYGLTFGIPEKVVTQKIRQCLYDLDLGPPSGTEDLALQDASVPGLMRATNDLGLPPLVFGTMSQLFGGMVNALPVGFSPTLNWEVSRQGGIWKDAYNHVHWSWLVWQQREHRPQVETAVAPMMAADKQLRRFATTGQQLFACVMDRYAAWKNDLTPGLKEAPRMLTEAYRIHYAFNAGHPSVSKDETVYIGAYDVDSPGSKPVPWINCQTLEILRHRRASIQLPERGDGTENREMNLWRSYIQPLLVKTDPQGNLREGRYELAIIGQKDL